MGFKITFVSIYLIILFTGAFLFNHYVEDRYCLAYQNTTLSISENMKPIDPLSYNDYWVVVCYNNKLEYELELLKVKNINLDIKLN